MRSDIKVAVIGAGPAGIIAAKKLKDKGISATIFEKCSEVGGIWNPTTKGAYKNTTMQNSKYTFHFSDMKPQEGSNDFPELLEVFEYLKTYVVKHDLYKNIYFNSKVEKLYKRDSMWNIQLEGKSEPILFDAVIVAIGELWKVKIPDYKGLKTTEAELTNSREYQSPDQFRNKKVLVVGGGVSGADISSDLVGYAKSISWAIGPVPKL